MGEHHEQWFVRRMKERGDMSRLVKGKARLGYLYVLSKCILVLFCVCRRPKHEFQSPYREAEYKKKNTNMNLVVDRTHIHVRSIHTPTDCCHRTSNFQSCDRRFTRFVTSFPDLHCTIIRTSHDEFYTRT